EAMRDLASRAKKSEAPRERHETAIQPSAEKLPEPVDEDRIHSEDDERKSPAFPSPHVDHPVEGGHRGDYPRRAEEAERRCPQALDHGVEGRKRETDHA